MNEWSRRRKRIILALVTFVLVFLIGLPVFLLVYKAPTCFDGKRNGDETGVDCGGSCQLLCTADSLPLIVKGDPRILKIAPNTFEVVALVNNPNISAGVYRAGYTFRLYNPGVALPIKTIEGVAHIPKNSTFVLFEGPFILEEGANPTRATLEWKNETLVWTKNENPFPNIRAVQTTLSGEDTSPRVDTVVENLTLDNISNLDLSVIVSDDAGNIFAAAKTFIETLPRNSRVPAVFTWPNPFDVREEACTLPVDIAFVIDRSGSMASISSNPPQPLTDVRNTAIQFVNQSGPNDRHAIISFANDASNPIETVLNSDVEQVRQAIAGIEIDRTSGSQNTNIGAGLRTARAELNSSRQRDNADKVIVLLTDGDPTNPIRAGEINYPENYALEVANLVKSDGIRIYTIGLGNKVDMAFLRQVSTTADDAYLAPSTRELANIYQQISTKICKQGLVGVDVYLRIFPDRSFIR